MPQARQDLQPSFKIESLGSYFKEGIAPVCCDLERLRLDPDLADWQTVARKALNLAGREWYDTLDVGKLPGVHILRNGAFTRRRFRYNVSK